MVKIHRLFAFFFSILLPFSAQETSFAQAQAAITVNPNITYQTIVGWEVVDYAGEMNSPAFPIYRDALYDQLVNDVGVNRIRLEIYPSVENNTDYYAQFLNGQITGWEWVHVYGYSPVNDNNDSNSINPNGFHFTSLDQKIDNMVVPIKQRLEARGEKLFVNLNFVHFGASRTGFYQYNDAQEYAEFMLAAFQHMQSKYGFVPDAVEVELEPSNTASFNGAKIGNAMVATAQRLQANGFAAPYFIVPSDPGMDTSITYYDQIIQVSGALPLIKEFSYHRYWSPNTASLQQIVNRALRDGKNTAMLEWWDPNNNYQVLHQDLKLGRNSAWQASGIAGPCNDPSDPNVGSCDGSQDHFGIDLANPANPQIRMGNRTKFYRQYYKYVRAGAQRFEATSTNSNFDPLAFINTNGTQVVVVKASAGGNFSIGGLSAGAYGIKYTTSTQYDIDLPGQNITAGQNLSANMPASGVITIYGKAVRGDINNDTQVNVLDVQACVNYILGIQDLGGRADVDGDGSINVLDVQAIVNIILGV